MIAQKATAWPATSASNICREYSFRVSRIVISERSSAWRKSVVDRLNHLCQLPIGWNGYGGQPVNFSSANFALKVLEETCDHAAPAPAVVPGSSGDLQIEWHTAYWDVELHVLGPYNVHAWRCSKGAPLEEGFELTNDFTAVRKWIEELSEPAFASSAAAA